MCESWDDHINEGGRHEQLRRRHRYSGRHEARGRRHPGCRRRPRQARSTRASVEARRRLPVRERLPGRPVHAARVGMLGPVRRQDHVGGARLGRGPLPDRLRHRGRARRARRRAGSTSARCSTTRRRARSSSPMARAIAPPDPRPTSPATAPSPPSAIRTATAGCSRRSRPGFPAGSRRDTTLRIGADLATALRRAAAAHGEHEARTGKADAELARLVRRVHGARAGRRGAAA